MHVLGPISYLLDVVIWTVENWHYIALGALAGALAIWIKRRK